MNTLIKKAGSTAVRLQLFVFLFGTLVLLNNTCFAGDELKIKLVSEEKNVVESIAKEFYPKTKLERSSNVIYPSIEKYIGVATLKEVDHVQRTGFKLFDKDFNLIGDVSPETEIPQKNGAQIGLPVIQSFYASKNAEILTLFPGSEPGGFRQIMVFEKNNKTYNWKSDLYLQGSSGILCDEDNKRIYAAGRRKGVNNDEVLCLDLDGQVIWSKPTETLYGLRNLNASKDFSIFQCTFDQDNPVGFGFELLNKEGKKLFSDFHPGGRHSSDISPDGSFALFVVNDNLFIYDIQNGYTKREFHFETESKWERRTRIVDCAVSSDSEIIAVMRYINGGQEYRLIILNREGEKLGESVITGGESLEFDGERSIIVRKHYQQQRRYELEK